MLYIYIYYSRERHISLISWYFPVWVKRVLARKDTEIFPGFTSTLRQDNGHLTAFYNPGMKKAGFWRETQWFSGFAHGWRSEMWLWIIDVDMISFASFFLFGVHLCLYCRNPSDAIDMWWSSCGIQSWLESSGSTPQWRFPSQNNDPNLVIYSGTHMFLGASVPPNLITISVDLRACRWLTWPGILYQGHGEDEEVLGFVVHLPCPVVPSDSTTPWSP